MNRDRIQQQLSAALADKYEILRWIGGGGMADVFLARHRIHGGLFAVKVLSVDLAQDERIVERFVREARTSATLSGHPNIVPIFDICAENGLYFLTMQYVEGEDLSNYLKQHGRISPSEAAKMIRQVADALVWASEKGVVHRDLKPSNLYLDKSGRLMVLDFGIAKAADVPSALTAATERVGTTYYMSPEQIKGEPCDVRSDLYSLGVVFFELLSGRKPFEGESYRAVELAHVQTPPPDLRQLDPSLPDELVAIVARLLEKDPKDRYQSPKDLVHDLDRYEAHVRTHASAVTSVEEKLQSPKEKTTTRWLGAAIAVLGALVVIAIVFLVLKKPAGLFRQPGSGSAPAPASEIVDRLGGRMSLVPSGTFIFGNNEPGAPNGEEVINDFPAFYIDETEVSNADYRKFCDATGHRRPDSPTFATQPDLPVTNVSFDDAEAYAAWLEKKLPSEKQWEKAARGTDGRIYPWGNDPWTNAPTTVQPVLSLPARCSPYHDYNMAGNVAEWTTSHFPAGPPNFQDMAKQLGSHDFSKDWKVVKGGWFSERPTPEFWKTYQRRGFPRDLALSPNIGFRCVKSVNLK